MSAGPPSRSTIASSGGFDLLIQAIGIYQRGYNGPHRQGPPPLPRSAVLAQSERMQTDSDTAITVVTRERWFRTAGTAPLIVDIQPWRGDVEVSGLHLYTDREAFRVEQAPAGQPATAPRRIGNDLSTHVPLRP
ncbi:hypothetical protein [Micromonospora sp. 050-3]|uniref:hypothetical protein n=1 Tax=Micromonospora sp. 050-3 TaxID=2789265 RepID=UPI00397D2845